MTRHRCRLHHASLIQHPSMHGDNYQTQKQPMNLYVSNLAYSVTDTDLRVAFEAFGAVTSARVILDRESGRSRGFGFVEMPENQEGLAAIEGLNGSEVGGRPIRVVEARPKEERPSSPGGGPPRRQGGGGGGYRNGGGGGGGGYDDHGGGGRDKDRGHRGNNRRGGGGGREFSQEDEGW